MDKPTYGTCSLSEGNGIRWKTIKLLPHFPNGFQTLAKFYYFDLIFRLYVYEVNKCHIRIAFGMDVNIIHK